MVGLQYHLSWSALFPCEVPPGKTHTFSNGSKGDPLELRIVVEPALDFQWFMTEAVKSGLRNGGSQKDMPLLEAGRFPDPSFHFDLSVPQSKLLMAHVWGLTGWTHPKKLFHFYHDQRRVILHLEGMVRIPDFFQ